MAATAGRPSGPASYRPILLRLYPAAWRARYGDEFLELLADRPPRLRDRLDIVAGALDARLHPQVGQAAPAEVPMRRDTSVAAIVAVGGLLLTLWAAIGASVMPRWGSGDIVGHADLLNISWFSGTIGSFVLGAALLLIAGRYDWSIGAGGAVGSVLTGIGLVLASFGGGIAALLLLGGGTALFAWRARGRIVGTVPALVLAGATFVVIAAFAWFAAGEGQETWLMWFLVAYGPAWIAFGLGIRSPEGSRYTPGSRPAALPAAGA